MKYMLDMLSEIGKLGAKPCSTPMAPNVHLTKENYSKILRDIEDWLGNCFILQSLAQICLFNKCFVTPQNIP